MTGGRETEGRGHGRRARARRLAALPAAALAAIGILALTVGPVFAHPLGNFTINHYAGIRVEPARIDLDVVIDQAEIPTFTERQRIDTDGDGQVSGAEMEAERQVACDRLASSLTLTAGGRPLALSVQAAGLSFPAGAGGLSTMRLVCEYAAPLLTALAGATEVRFVDRSSPGRIGWREIVVRGDGVTLTGDPGALGAPGGGISHRLTTYPQDLLSTPLAMTEATVVATPGGASAAAPCIADAFPLATEPTATMAGFGCEPSPAVGGSVAGETATQPVTQRATQPAAAAVPGGVGGEIASLLQARDLTPPIVIVSLLTAMALGAAHALTPGHGKTVMAAYLVGTRGTPRHALALGLTVTLAHTIGVLLLALVVLSVSRVTPESFNHVTGIVSGVLVVGIGGWLFVSQGLPAVRRRLHRADRHDDDHDDHGHDHHHGPDHDQGHDVNHSHAGVSHRHLPDDGTPLTWRSLFALGLFGGLVPSVNALIILLATLATGRAAYGLVLVVAFGAGMALVLGGIGLGLLYASRWMARSPSSSALGGVLALAPAITSGIIVAVGLLVTGQAIFATPVL